MSRNAPRPGASLIPRPTALRPPLPPSAPRRARTRKPLDEDAYVASLQRIIERDFFPHLPLLRRRTALLPDTPATSTAPPDTPETSDGRTPGAAGGATHATAHGSVASIGTPTPHPGALLEAAEVPTQAQALDCALRSSLDVFHAKFTSEDNAAFEDIVLRNEKQRRVAKPWLALEAKPVETIQDNEKAAPPTGDSGAGTLTIYGDTRKATPVLWDYTPKNTLMFYPQALALQDASSASGPKEIIHANTRFPGDPLLENIGGDAESDVVETTAAEREAAAREAATRGYNFVDKSPSVREIQRIIPECPVTWGSLPATPMRIQETPEREYRMMGVRQREILAHDLERRASAKKRNVFLQSKNALSQSQSRSSTPGFVAGTPDRRIPGSVPMSPAAHALAAKLKRTLTGSGGATAANSPFAALSPAAKRRKESPFKNVNVVVMPRQKDNLGG